MKHQKNRFLVSFLSGLVILFFSCESPAPVSVGNASTNVGEYLGSSEQSVTATTALSNSLVYLSESTLKATNCNCIIRDLSGRALIADASCQPSERACYDWCNRTHNPSGIWRVSIQYSKGVNCGPKPNPNTPNCPSIDIYPHKEFVMGTEWRTCSNYRFIFQHDGNLVMYNPSGKPVFHTNTHNKGANLLALQADGNLVIYDTSMKPLWNSRTHGNPGSYLAIQGDGNAVIYSKDKKPLWATNTNGK